MLATMVASPASISIDHAAQVARENYGLAAEIERLTGERDQNFRVRAAGGDFVLKIAPAAEELLVTDLSTAALLHLERVDPYLPCPRVCRDYRGQTQVRITDASGMLRIARLLTWLPGIPLRSSARSTVQQTASARIAARIGRALATFDHPAARRELIWDLRVLPRLLPLLDDLPDLPRKELIAAQIADFRDSVLPVLGTLRQQVIHNDINDRNILVDPAEPASITGVIDYGDMIHGPLVFDLAILAAAQATDTETLDETIARLAYAYSEIESLTAAESGLLRRLIGARILMGTVIPSWHRCQNPASSHYSRVTRDFVSERLAIAEVLFREPNMSDKKTDADAALARRQRALGPTYGHFYEEPLQLVRGKGVWLYDSAGRRYLDAYNNVPVVGHCHPRVVARLAQQAATLNTHTRYLTDSPVELAERLLATMPSEIGHVVYTCTGSEANDLAARIAKAATGGSGFIITEHAYHGTTELVAGMSPSTGLATGPGIYRVPAPIGPGPAAAFDDAVRHCLARMKADGVKPAALLVDTIFSSDGVAADPPGFLTKAVDAIRAAGGLFIADEVQAGFGRTGGGMWGFERHGVIPDIVTMGKPMGNGHPIAAIAARPEWLAAFARSTRYFNTFGGNTVSCAVALAVLDVIADEQLLRNALEVGDRLRQGLAGLATRHECVGDIRGAGLFIGVTLRANDSSARDAKALTQAVVNELRRRGALIGTAGRNGDVLKIRPPLPIRPTEADQLVEWLDQSFSASS